MKHTTVFEEMDGHLLSTAPGPGSRWLEMHTAEREADTFTFHRAAATEPTEVEPTPDVAPAGWSFEEDGEPFRGIYHALLITFAGIVVGWFVVRGVFGLWLLLKGWLLS